MRTLLAYRWIRMLRRARFVRRREGITSIEFAFITPILILIIMGIVEFALIMFTMAAMESATATTSRLGKTGFTTPGITREQTILNFINARTAGLLDPTLLTITSTVYASFDNIGDPEPFVDSNGNGMYNFGEPFSDINGNGQWDSDMGAAGLGDANDIVVYTVSYPWPIVTPLIGAIVGNPFTITVRTAVRNEPYSVQQVGG